MPQKPRQNIKCFDCKNMFLGYRQPGRDGNYRCSTCAYNRDVAKKNKYNKEMKLLSVGITDKIYNTTLEIQNGQCKICSRIMNLVVDHCHTTNKFRGLLCDNCNCAIGLLDDSHERCNLVAMYLAESDGES